MPTLIIGAVILLLLALAPTFMDSFFVFLLTRILFMGLAAMSLYVLMGLGNMLSFAQMGVLWYYRLRYRHHGNEAWLELHRIGALRAWLGFGCDGCVRADRHPHARQLFPNDYACLRADVLPRGPSVGGADRRL